MTEFPDLTLPLTVCSWMWCFASLSSMIWISKLFPENAGKRVLISDHTTQHDTRMFPGSNSGFSHHSYGKLTPFWRACLPSSHYHCSDKCFNETELIFTCLWYKALRNERIRNFHPASALSFIKASFCSVHKPWSFQSNDTPWAARIYSEGAGSENIHILGMFCFHG